MGLTSLPMREPSLLDYVISKLEEARGNWPLIVRKTGVPMSTIDRIARGETANPGIRHIESLANYFREQEAA
jgi:hypothetical protein